MSCRTALLGMLSLAAGITACLAGEPEMKADFFVAVDGSDGSPGTKAKPFATLTKARDAARLAGAGQARRITVRGGKYYDVALALGPQDSGLTIGAAPGEQPILYGGRLVKGWEQDGEKFYAAKLPGVKEGTWDFRTLIVDGKLRPRARLPKTGAFKHLNDSNVQWNRERGCLWPVPTEEQMTTMNYKEGDLGEWLDVRNAEITVYHNWDESFVGVKALDAKKRVVTFANRCSIPPGAYGHAPKAHDYVVWNVREGMHEPGQWYLDRTAGRVVYRPRPDEDINKLTVIAPMVESVIRLAGDKDHPVHDVTIKGLTLNATTTPLRSPGWACRAYQGAVEAEWIRACRFVDLNIQGAGGQGLRIRNGERNLIAGCIIRDTGAGGIYLIDGVEEQVTDNRVGGVGRVYASAVGIGVASHCDYTAYPAIHGDKWKLSHDNAILHNEVFDTPYCGIEFGGLRNRIEKNLIRDVMQVLNDGAAVYGQGSGHVIRGNIARGIPGGKLAAAYYPDELNDDCVVEENLAVDCAWPSHNHKSKNLTIRNNVFVNAKGDIKITTPTARGAIVLEKNIIYAAGAISIEGATWKENLVFSQKGAYKGVPGDVVKEDPMFVDPDKGDYRFKPDSPAAKLGIKPLDLSDVGPRAGRRKELTQ
ncbi:MAG: right-handed parallel beta-helix repeat-containing protein [Planctomycetota bacterium]